MSNSETIVGLIYKYIRKDISTEEDARLQSWVSQSAKNRLFFEEITQTGYLFTESMAREHDDAEIDLDKAWQQLVQKGWSAPDVTLFGGSLVAEASGASEAATSFSEPPAKTARVFSFRMRMMVAAAAVVILAGAVVMYMLLQPKQNKQITVTNTPVKHSHDVTPNVNNAVLTLADGTTVTLDSAQGLLAQQGNTKITKLANGQIIYSPLTPSAVGGKGRPGPAEIFYNTVTVPRGGNVVSLALADGSKVWLNAASSIRYPTAFTGKVRRVEIKGEAYFEVAKTRQGSNQIPFVVSEGDVEVTVLGTEFNVNAYPEEGDIKVTLLEGKVKVSQQPQTTNSKPQTLLPGQQAIATANGNIQLNSDVDTEVVLAWKNGLFMFNNTGITSIMRQIQRWYDVEVIFQGDVKHWTFNGQISRYSNASKVLEMLEATGTVSFRIEDRKIYVMPAPSMP